MLRDKLTYSNLMSSVAVFVAIGGTSYAATKLPRDSVGQRQLKANSVGAAELRARAVTSSKIRNGTVAVDDLHRLTRDALKGDPGPMGPSGVPLRSSLNSAGTQVAGNAASSATVALGKFIVGFSRDVAGCTPAATLARNPGTTVENPGPGSIVVAIEAGKVAVETYDAAGTPTNLPFNLLVAC
jgi:hypothetical protein